MACGLPVVGCMEDDLEGMVITKKKTRSLYEGIRQVLDNYQEYQAKALHTSHKLSWFNRSKELINLVKKPIGMKEILVKEYSNTIKRFITPKPSKVEVIIDFIDGARCELKGNFSDSYKIEFIDKNNVVWQDTIQCGMWTKVSKKYFIPWKIKITNLTTNELIFDYDFNCKNKKVYIYFDSKSIGDTIAWFPYVEEFRKKHGCEVICSTFHNEWFEPNYPEIKFVPPGYQPENLYASFGIGWYYFNNNELDMSKHPQNILNIPLQQTASDILGLDFKEISPKLKTLPLSPIKEKYVTLSIQSTCQAKYWNHPTGWEQVIKYIQSKGYKVAIVDQHRTFGASSFMNTSPQADYHFHETTLENVMSVIRGAEFHIGVGSGLSWVAWALGTPVVLVSSFSKPFCEFTSNCTRIYNESPTSGYFNTHKLDPSDWNWHPYRKINSMEDWYEIETITPEQVIEAIKTNLL